MRRLRGHGGRICTPSQWKRWFLVLVGLLGSATAHLAVASDDFVTGWNHPWIAYGHDFGSNGWGHDGIITSGWTYQTYYNTKGFIDTRRVDAGRCGGPALRITPDLVGGPNPDNPNEQNPKARGEVELSVLNHPPPLGGVPAPEEPLNLDGVTVRARVWLPPGSAGWNGKKTPLDAVMGSSSFSRLACPIPATLPTLRTRLSTRRGRTFKTSGKANASRLAPL